MANKLERTRAIGSYLRKCKKIKRRGFLPNKPDHPRAIESYLTKLQKKIKRSVVYSMIVAQYLQMRHISESVDVSTLFMKKDIILT